MILTIVQKFVKSPYLEVKILETKYLSVFGIYRPINYRPDELFQNFLQLLYLSIDIDIW